MFYFMYSWYTFNILYIIIHECAQRYNKCKLKTLSHKDNLAIQNTIPSIVYPQDTNNPPGILNVVSYWYVAIYLLFLWR